MSRCGNDTLEKSGEEEEEQGPAFQKLQISPAGGEGKVLSHLCREGGGSQTPGAAEGV